LDDESSVHSFSVEDGEEVCCDLPGNPGK
jgi:hypothetical protein